MDVSNYSNYLIARRSAYLFFFLVSYSKRIWILNVLESLFFIYLFLFFIFFNIVLFCEPVMMSYFKMNYLINEFIVPSKKKKKKSSSPVRIESEEMIIYDLLDKCNFYVGIF